jgi:hypothetical protein
MVITPEQVENQEKGGEHWVIPEQEENLEKGGKNVSHS